MRTRKWIALVGIVGAGLAAMNCSPAAKDGSTTTTEGASSTASLEGAMTVDGSSTVYPISERMAELFLEQNPKVRLTVAMSGTGGGFKKFGNGEVEITGASRAIETEEIEAAKKNGIEFVEIPVAFDGLTVVINPQNDFAKTLTVAELKKIWEPGSKVTKWSDVRAGFPAEKITLFGAGTDSGTFDYFTKAINGEEKACRADYMASEDDNVLVQGVAGDKYALGFFGFAYYEKNKDKLTAVAIDEGKGKPAVAPTFETISDFTYQPLSRPLFMYVNTKALDKPEVVAFLKFIMTKGKNSIAEVGYVPLPNTAYELALARLESKATGTLFKGAEVGVSVEAILKREAAK